MLLLILCFFGGKLFSKAPHDGRVTYNSIASFLKANYVVMYTLPLII